MQQARLTNIGHGVRVIYDALHKARTIAPNKYMDVDLFPKQLEKLIRAATKGDTLKVSTAGSPTDSERGSEFTLREGEGVKEPPIREGKGGTQPQTLAELGPDRLQRFHGAAEVEDGGAPVEAVTQAPAQPAPIEHNAEQQAQEPPPPPPEEGSPQTALEVLAKASDYNDETLLAHALRVLPKGTISNRAKGSTVILALQRQAKIDSNK